MNKMMVRAKRGEITGKNNFLMSGIGSLIPGR